jgi:hypothetical protein
MTCYVDELSIYRKGRLSGAWCHLMTDQDDLTELHAMADAIGLDRRWFQATPTHPHYDLRANKRTAAIRAGAVAVASTELVRRCSLLPSLKARRGELV